MMYSNNNNNKEEMVYMFSEKLIIGTDGNLEVVGEHNDCEACRQENVADVVDIVTKLNRFRVIDAVESVSGDNNIIEYAFVKSELVRGDDYDGCDVCRQEHVDEVIEVVEGLNRDRLIDVFEVDIYGDDIGYVFTTDIK